MTGCCPTQNGRFRGAIACSPTARASWQVADLSANGTFLNGEAEAIGHGQPRDLRGGDRLRLGAYEIELRIADAEAPRYASVPRADPFVLDPFPSRVTPQTGPLSQDPLLHRGSEHDPFAAGLGPPSIHLPPDYDPLAPEADEASFAGQTQPDRSRISMTHSARPWRMRCYRTTGTASRRRSLSRPLRQRRQNPPRYRRYRTYRNLHRRRPRRALGFVMS
jgi:predicted component of type VI protein secretion system